VSQVNLPQHGYFVLKIHTIEKHGGVVV